MATSFVPQAPRAAGRNHSENARFAVSLGAAFAILCAVVFETPESQAAGGLFELLFGGGSARTYNIQPMPSYGDAPGDYGVRYSQRRHARRSRTHYAHSRRSRGELRVADHHATERHHLPSSTRRAGERRQFAGQKDWLISVNEVETAKLPAFRQQSERRPSAPAAATSPAETVSYAEATAPATASSGMMSRRALCVRACDGYYFPIATKSSEASAQQSCDRLCPGAQTHVFLMPRGSTNVDEAVSAKGSETYASFVARINPDDAKSKSCGCPQTAGNLNDTAAFLSDLTLRPGDTVVTPEGVRIVRRGSHYPFKASDFLSLAETRDVPRSTRGALYAIDRALKTPYGRLAVAANSERRHHRRDL